MKKNIFNISIGLCLVALTLILTGCANRYEEQLKELHNQTASRLSTLKTSLDKGELVNALLIKKYANELEILKPDYKDIASLMKQESTSNGKAFNAIKKRMESVNLIPTTNNAAEAGIRELQLVYAAADGYEFNNSLADVVNTLASLSDGKLAVINVPASEKESAQQANALVGNPAYGNWQQGSGGHSFWAWYGMYSMFNNVFRQPYSYSSWSSRPHYSYYGNYGRNRWGSDVDVNRNRNLSRQYPSKYNKPSVATKARYSRSASRSSSYGGSSASGNKSTSKNAYGSSSRSSSYSSSRSSRSGK